ALAPELAVVLEDVALVPNDDRELLGTRLPCFFVAREDLRQRERLRDAQAVVKLLEGGVDGRSQMSLDGLRLARDPVDIPVAVLPGAGLIGAEAGGREFLPGLLDHGGLSRLRAGRSAGT